MTRTRSSLCILALVTGVLGSAYGCNNISGGYGAPPQATPDGDAASPTSVGLTDCSCIPQTFSSPACNACNEAVTADATECQPVSAACAASNGCRALYACVSKCATGPCIDTCVTASDTASAAALVQVFACSCAKCAGSCTAATTFECLLAEPDAGTEDAGDASDGNDADDAGDAGDAAD